MRHVCLKHLKHFILTLDLLKLFASSNVPDTQNFAFLVPENEALEADLDF